MDMYECVCVWTKIERRNSLVHLRGGVIKWVIALG
jgi:hypothetical protein